MACIVVTIMAADQKEAEKIGRSLVEKQLAACANIVPGVRSRYWWKGTIETADETLIIAKTTAALFDELAAEVKRLHSYQVPEIVAVPITHSSGEYLRWIEESVRKA